MSATTSNSALPITLAVSVMLVGCLSSGGFETARTAPEGERTVTSAVGISATTGPAHTYELTDAEGNPHTGNVISRLPAAPIQMEYMGRVSRSLYDGLEAELTLQNVMLHPFGFGGGLGTGVKYQFLGGQDGPVAVATALRGFVHGHAAGNGGGSSSFFTAQAQARLIASFHSDDRGFYDQGFAFVVAPKLVAEHVGHYLSPPSPPSYTGSTRGILGGASVGPAWTSADGEALYLELSVLVGDSAGSPWPASNRFALMPRSTHHVRVMVGVGRSFTSAGDEEERLPPAP